MQMKIRNFKKSDEYRTRIHNLIPSAAHTCSKCDNHYPLKSPTDFTNGKGVYLSDLDGNRFLDCPIFLTSLS